MKSKSQRSYLVLVLLIILAFNFVDRSAIGLVLEDIKLDLHLSDTQLGVLTGIAFALFYATMGIPIARWADRGNRVNIIAVTTALWSVALALCGRVSTFVQLLIVRSAVAVGEAGCIPPANSLIADIFSRAERARAVSIYMLGASLGPLIGYFAAGWLSQMFGWRTMFLMIGLPGIALAAIVKLSLRDPRTTNPEQQADAQPDLVTTSRALLSNATLRHLLFCFAVEFFFGAGLMQWQPTFYIRSFGLATSTLGTYFAVIYGVGGLLGTYLGGEWAHRYASENESLQLKMMALACFVSGGVTALSFLTPSSILSLTCVAIGVISISAVNGPLFATIQVIVPERMRAMSVAVLYLFANLVGLGLGPLSVGILSDLLRQQEGAESLRWALLFMCPGQAWVAWHMWRASLTVADDIAGAASAEHMMPIAASVQLNG